MDVEKVLSHIPKVILDKMTEEEKDEYVVQNAMGWEIDDER